MKPCLTRDGDCKLKGARDPTKMLTMDAMTNESHQKERVEDRKIGPRGIAIEAHRSVDRGSDGELNDLLHAKWLDPIASSLAAHEALRRGRRNDLDEVVGNMKRYFSDIPDTAALVKLAGRDMDRPNGPRSFSTVCALSPVTPSGCRCRPGVSISRVLGQRGVLR